MKGTNVVFNLQVVDKQGANWRIWSDGEADGVPGFEVRNADDLVLWRGNFEYG